jgi:hypothetical protein
MRPGSYAAAGAGNDHDLHVVRATFPTLSSRLAAPPIARTDIVSGRVARCSFYAAMVSHARYNPKSPRRGVGVEEDAYVVVDHVIGQLPPFPGRMATSPDATL